MECNLRFYQVLIDLFLKLDLITSFLDTFFSSLAAMWSGSPFGGERCGSLGGPRQSGARCSSRLRPPTKIEAEQLEDSACLHSPTRCWRAAVASCCRCRSPSVAASYHSPAVASSARPEHPDTLIRLERRSLLHFRLDWNCDRTTDRIGDCSG